MTTLRVPDRVGDLGSYLKEQREQARLSLRQLATAAGVSNPYLSQIERGLRRPSAEVLQQIARGLRISAEVLYVRAGILEESKGLEVEVAIRTDPTLTERQRSVLLDIYATFQAENGRNGHADARTGSDAGTGSAVEPGTPVEPDPSHQGGPAAPKPASSKAAARTPTPRTPTPRRTGARSAAAPAPASGATAGSAGTAGPAGGSTAPTAR